MSKKSFGIALVLAGSPIIYFLRDGLGLAPGNFYFTGVLMSLYLSLLFDLRFFINFKIHKPNLSLFYIAMLFWISSFSYFLYSNYEDKLRDVFYMLYLFIFFIGLLSIRNIDNEVYNLINSLFIVTFVSNLLFIMFIRFFYLKVTLREIGSRAYIGGEEGNPNLYANIAYFGIISSYFFLKMRNKNIFYTFFGILNILLSLLVIALSQNRTVLICLLLLINILLIKKTISFLVSLKFKMSIKKVLVYTLTISIFIVLLNSFLSKDFMETYIHNYINYLNGLIENIKGGQGDQSSIQRILSFNLVKSELLSNPLDYLLGKGYKYEWLDIPILQAIRDMGIFGLSFIFLHIMIFFQIFKYFYFGHRIENKLELGFLFSLYLLIFINSLSHGQPYDLSHWLPLSLVIRFAIIRLNIPKVVRAS